MLHIILLKTSKLKFSEIHIIHFVMGQLLTFFKIIT